VNGHTKPSKKTEVAEEPKPRRVRKSRSRVADLEAPVERESIGAVAV
jgi:hypothetical protein